MLAATHRKSSGDTHEKLDHCGSRGVGGSLASARSGSLDVMTGEGYGGGGHWSSLHVVCLPSLTPIPQFPSGSGGLSLGSVLDSQLEGTRALWPATHTGKNQGNPLAWGKMLYCHM